MAFAVVAVADEGGIQTDADRRLRRRRLGQGRVAKLLADFQRMMAKCFRARAQQAKDAPAHQRRRDSSSERKDAPEADPALVTTGNARANACPSQSGDSQYKAIAGAAPSLHRTESRSDAVASP